MERVPRGEGKLTASDSWQMSSCKLLRIVNRFRRPVSVPRWVIAALLLVAGWRTFVWLEPVWLNRSAPLLTTGIVISERGFPLADADVFLVSGKNFRGGRTRSDKAGHFDLRARYPGGPFHLIVSKFGYASTHIE